jgi:hypothetical protein
MKYLVGKQFARDAAGCKHTTHLFCAGICALLLWWEKLLSVVIMWLSDV